ncbi:MAG: hypothetical protein IKN53_02460 [Oscillibacter sp.]|nr:hypothetical protein [Oscillibacter sp.]
MGLFERIREKRAEQREAERQRLMELSEKELLVEIALLLKEISRKSDEIQMKQVIYSD